MALVPLQEAARLSQGALTSANRGLSYIAGIAQKEREAQRNLDARATAALANFRAKQSKRKRDDFKKNEVAFLTEVDTERDLFKKNYLSEQAKKALGADKIGEMTSEQLSDFIIALEAEYSPEDIENAFYAKHGNDYLVKKLNKFEKMFPETFDKTAFKDFRLGHSFVSTPTALQKIAEAIRTGQPIPAPSPTTDVRNLVSGAMQTIKQKPEKQLEEKPARSLSEVKSIADNIAVALKAEGKTDSQIEQAVRQYYETILRQYRLE